MPNLLRSLTVACVLLPALGAAAHADTFNFYPTSSAGDGQLGTSAIYTFGSDSITAYGFECTHYGSTTCLSGTTLANHVTVGADHLYTKNDGSSERGLGISNDPQGDHEISDEDFIDLDMTHLGSTTGTLTISSLQAGESFFFCYGNSNSGWNSSNCSSLFTGTTGSDVTETFNLGTFHDISLIGVHNDVLLASVTTPSATPEPSSLALLGTGILGLAGAARRKFAL